MKGRIYTIGKLLVLIIVYFLVYSVFHINLKPEDYSWDPKNLNRGDTIVFKNSKNELEILLVHDKKLDTEDPNPFELGTWRYKEIYSIEYSNKNNSNTLPWGVCFSRSRDNGNLKLTFRFKTYFFADFEAKDMYHYLLSKPEMLNPQYQEVYKIKGWKAKDDFSPDLPDNVSTLWWDRSCGIIAYELFNGDKFDRVK